jgi:hypothetical protein
MLKPLIADAPFPCFRANAQCRHRTAAAELNLAETTQYQGSAQALGPVLSTVFSMIFGGMARGRMDINCMLKQHTHRISPEVGPDRSGDLMRIAMEAVRMQAMILQLWRVGVFEREREGSVTDRAVPSLAHSSLQWSWKVG